MGAVQFIENLDRTTLTVSDEEYEKNVEAAVSAIAEKPEPQGRAPPLQVHIAEKSSLSRPEVTRRHSEEGEQSTSRRSTSSRDGPPNTSPAMEEEAAVAGLLRTIQKPLSTIGRIFSDEGSKGAPQANGNPTARGRQPASTPRRSPPGFAQGDGPTLNGTARASSLGNQDDRYRRQMTAEEAAARQASAEMTEAQRIQRLEHVNVVEYVFLYWLLCLTVAYFG